jgi:transposase
MPVMHARGAGVDVPKKPVVACVLPPVGHETRLCGTMTVALLSLADWRLACGCPHGAIERTGDSW